MNKQIKTKPLQFHFMKNKSNVQLLNSAGKKGQKCELVVKRTIRYMNDRILVMKLTIKFKVSK